MVIFSRIIGSKFTSANAFSRLFANPQTSKNGLLQQIRTMSDGHMVIQPSRFQWDKFKDLVHYYVMVGLLPCLAVVTYVNIFVGPATLTEVPEGYEPKHWEYHRHPITRFLARYFYTNPQQEYEKMCHYVYEQTELAEMRFLEKKVKAKMAENHDYEAYYYTPVTAKYLRLQKRVKEEQQENLLGD